MSIAVNCILFRLTVSKVEFRGQFPYLEKATGYTCRIYTVSREPIRLPEIHYWSGQCLAFNNIQHDYRHPRIPT